MSYSHMRLWRNGLDLKFGFLVPKNIYDVKFCPHYKNHTGLCCCLFCRCADLFQSKAYCSSIAAKNVMIIGVHKSRRRLIELTRPVCTDVQYTGCTLVSIFPRSIIIASTMPLVGIKSSGHANHQ